MDQEAGRTAVTRSGTTRQRLETPRAAGVAGIAFTAFFTAALLLLSQLPILAAGDDEVEQWFAAGGDTVILVSALYLMPFAAIAFLWFVAVLRDQIGEREDRFFGTVLFGSGVLFVALILAAAAIVGSLVIGVRYLDQPAPSARTLDETQSFAYALLLIVASRVAAVFMLATASIGLRFTVFPRWFVLLGYAIGIVLLLTATFWEPILYVVPAWVAVVSLFILRRPRWSEADRVALGSRP